MSPEELKKVEGLEKQVLTLTQEKTALTTQVEQATSLIGELKEKLAEKVAGKTEVATLKIGEDTYQFLSEFHYKGQEITLEVLKEDTKLAQELVKERVGDLRKVPAQKA